MRKKNAFSFKELVVTNKKIILQNKKVLEHIEKRLEEGIANLKMNIH